MVCNVILHAWVVVQIQEQQALAEGHTAGRRRRGQHARWEGAQLGKAPPLPAHV